MWKLKDFDWQCILEACILHAVRIYIYNFFMKLLDYFDTCFIFNLQK